MKKDQARKVDKAENVSKHMTLIIKKMKRSQEMIRSLGLKPNSPTRGKRLKTTPQKKTQERKCNKTPDEKVLTKKQPKREKKVTKKTV